MLVIADESNKHTGHISSELALCLYYDRPTSHTSSTFFSLATAKENHED